MNCTPGHIVLPGEFDMQRLCVQVESEDVVFALETIVENFGSEMAPFAVGPLSAPLAGLLASTGGPSQLLLMPALR